MNPSQPREYLEKAEVGLYRGMAAMKAPNEMPSELEILKQKAEALKYELSKVEEAIEALESHPEIEKVMRLVRRAL